MEIGIGLWLLLAVSIGVLAAREFGRSGFGWFLLAVLLTPLVGLLLFLLPARRKACPFCAELIAPSAVLCRFCGRETPATADRFGLPLATRLVLLGLILAVIAASLSRCDIGLDRWRGKPPIQVQFVIM